MEDNITQKFKHGIDKSKIPTCSILGVKIAAVNMNWLIDFTIKNIKVLSGDYVCVANVHTTVTAWEDEQYRDIQNNGIMAIPDGGPLSSIGRKRGFNDMQRTTGPSYMEAIFKLSSQYKFKHYFYGSTEETLEKLYCCLQKFYPEIQITGMLSPPFRELNADEESDIIARINETDSDFVWVGLGAPKQEKWMAKHQGQIKGLMIGVGAGFDYFAGNISRAPAWMQKHNLEWLYRLIQEPTRLFGRYLRTNTKFIWNAILKGK